MDVNWRHRHQQTKTKKILMQRFSSFVAPLSLQRSKLCHDEILLKSLIRLPLTYQSGKYSASGAQMPMVALFAVTWRFSFCKHLQFWREPGAFLESNLRASVRRWTSYYGDRRILIPSFSSRHWNGPNSKDKKKTKKVGKRDWVKKRKNMIPDGVFMSSEPRRRFFEGMPSTRLMIWGMIEVIENNNLRRFLIWLHHPVQMRVCGGDRRKRVKASMLPQYVLSGISIGIEKLSPQACKPPLKSSNYLSLV